MSRRMVTVRLAVRYSWWLKHYLAGVAFVAAMTDREPDWAKVEKWVRRGVTVVQRPVRGVLAA